MFLLPDGAPFFGGTYFPRESSYGRPGFKRVLMALSEAYRREHDKVVDNAQQFRAALAEVARAGRSPSDGGDPLRADTVDRAAAKLAMHIDRREGGFQGVQKFPNPKSLELIMRASRRAARRGEPDAAEMFGLVALTLRKMAAGGIYDQLGGGFHRYSTDPRWLVPHFEKMLYDNGQLLALYAEAWQWSREPLYERVVRETVGWMERELRVPEGGLATAQDADSEGVEGKYFVWTPVELRAVLDEEEAQLVERCLDVSDGGNWQDPHGHGPEGASILHVVDGPRDEREERQLAGAKAKLLAARSRRVPPGLDDKCLASSNGLALAGLAEAGRIFGEPAFLDGARRTAEFLLTRMRDPAGRLFRTFKGGVARLPGTLDDHAYVADGLIALYEATGEARWLEEAHRLTELCVRLFCDARERAFYVTAADDPGLIERPVSLHDGAVPSGMSVCLENLVRLGDATGERAWVELAEGVLRNFHDSALGSPHGFANFLCALDLAEEPPVEVVLAGPADGAAALGRAVAQVYLPNRMIVHASQAPALLAPLLAGKGAVDGRAAAWVCRAFACERPETDPARLRDRLGGSG
jgi:uncharacterized protein YyaL (SSP411 family)